MEIEILQISRKSLKTSLKIYMMVFKEMEDSLYSSFMKMFSLPQACTTEIFREYIKEYVEFYFTKKYLKRSSIN